VPRIRRQNLPRNLWAHLLERVKGRQISVDQLGLLADWMATEPNVPDGKWFKRFPGMTICSEGEFVATFLQPGQAPTGKELN